ncbi:hypothetical protein M513_11964 [Trichuris suis]|uniref:Uncharacterized protein n=1 Tax=Trichuris suis TaxID=68888 RepID=A0A085LQA9_9BILA|nr:hypothetical protein M513_11964 [Trichuris suis]
MCLSSPYTIRFLFVKVKIYQTSKDVMTVVLVCRIPFDQFLTEGGAKYEYTWSGWNSAAAEDGSSLDVKATAISVSTLTFTGKD